MEYGDLLKRLTQRPFRPFALRLLDGGAFEIRRADLIMVTRTAALIGAPAATNAPLVDQFHLVELRHVARLEDRGTAARS